MEKHVIINSFHSHSIPLLRKSKPEAIISFDSHLDDFLFVSSKTLDTVEKLNPKDMYALLRSCVQYYFGTMFKDITKCLVIPKFCFFCDVVNTSPDHAHNGKQELKYVFNFKKNLFKNAFNTRIFYCPPNDIEKLSKNMEKYASVLDIDLDYVYEFKDYCFTKPPCLKKYGNNKSVFGTLKQVKNAIKLINPNLIILSEIVSSALFNAEPIQNFLKWLKQRGYFLEYGNIIDEDKEAFKLKKKADYFLGEIIPELITRNNFDSLKNSKILKKTEDIFLKELKKYYDL